MATSLTVQLLPVRHAHLFFYFSCISSDLSGSCQCRIPVPCFFDQAYTQSGHYHDIIRFGCLTEGPDRGLHDYYAYMYDDRLWYKNRENNNLPLLIITLALAVQVCRVYY